MRRSDPNASQSTLSIIGVITESAAGGRLGYVIDFKDGQSFGEPQAFHPDNENNKHEMYFTCDDIEAQMADLRRKHVEVGETSEERWGTRTTISLPGGGTIGLYQPKHPVTFQKNSSKKKARRTRRQKTR